MTKEASLYSFFNSFGIPFYVSTNVPHDAQPPYGTYQNIVGSNFDQVSITVRLWFYSTRETEINAMAEKISKRIGSGGIQIPCDGGCIWIQRGLPFCQAVNADDENIRSRYINLSLEYITTN